MRLGTMVTPLSRRRPQVVAKHLTTLDHLSGGRAIFGVGLGDPPDLDFSDFGDEPSYQVRAAITDEALTVLGGLLGDGRASHHGDHLDVDASVRPLPVQRPRVPIWVAGRAPHTRPLARGEAVGRLRPDRRARSCRRPTWRRTSASTPATGGTSSRSGHPASPAEEFAAVGVTWLMRSTWPSEQGWLDELRELAAAPPA